MIMQQHKEDKHLVDLMMQRNMSIRLENQKMAKYATH